MRAGGRGEYIQAIGGVANPAAADFRKRILVADVLGRRGRIGPDAADVLVSVDALHQAAVGQGVYEEKAADGSRIIAIDAVGADERRGVAYVGLLRFDDRDAAQGGALMRIRLAIFKLEQG